MNRLLPLVKFLWLCALLAGFVIAVPSQASAAIVFYAVSLNGAVEVPVNASPGSGAGLITVDTTLRTMRIQTNFARLLGNTTAAHIHAASTLAPFNNLGTAGVATQTPTFTGFPLGVTSGTFDQTLDLTAASSYNAAFITANGGTTATAEAALLSFIDQGRAYLNIHTSFAPGGEIRGFITAVPEPSSFALSGLAALGLAVGYWRKRKKGQA